MKEICVGGYRKPTIIPTLHRLRIGAIYFVKVFVSVIFSQTHTMPIQIQFAVLLLLDASMQIAKMKPSQNRLLLIFSNRNKFFYDRHEEKKA